MDNVFKYTSRQIAELANVPLSIIQNHLYTHKSEYAGNFIMNTEGKMKTYYYNDSVVRVVLDRYKGFKRKTQYRIPKECDCNITALINKKIMELNAEKEAITAKIKTLNDALNTLATI